MQTMVNMYYHCQNENHDQLKTCIYLKLDFIQSIFIILCNNLFQIQLITYHNHRYEIYQFIDAVSTSSSFLANLKGRRKSLTGV